MAVQASQSEYLEETTIVDTDVHATFLVDKSEVYRYLEEPHRTTMKRSGGMLGSPVSYHDSWVGGDIENQMAQIEGVEDLHQKLSVEFPVDYPILNHMGFLPGMPQTDLAVALMPAYNDMMLDQFLDDYDRAFALADIATQRPDAAAEELDRMSAEDQFVGGLIANTRTNPPIGDPVHDPIFEAAEDNDMALALHSAAGLRGSNHSFSRQYQASGTFFLQHELSFPWSHMRTLVSLIENGVPEKFPDLDFVFLEASIGWVPHMMNRLEREYELRKRELPISTSPVELIERSFYFGTQPLEEPNSLTQLMELIDLVGTGNITFSTDYPHWDHDNPDIMTPLLRGDEFTEADRERILYRNARDVFGLDI